MLPPTLTVTASRLQSTRAHSETGYGCRVSEQVMPSHYFRGSSAAVYASTAASSVGTSALTVVFM